jgi:hypothetical protein
VCRGGTLKRRLVRPRHARIDPHTHGVRLRILRMDKRAQNKFNMRQSLTKN